MGQKVKNTKSQVQILKKKCFFFFWQTECCNFFFKFFEKGRTNGERACLKIGVLSMGMEARGDFGKNE